MVNRHPFGLISGCLTNCYAFFSLSFLIFAKAKNISVHDLLRCQGQLDFSRWLNPILFARWLEVVDSVYHYNFKNGNDIPMWRWTKNICFSTKFVYDILTKEESGRGFKHIWKAKIPYKIKIFMWLAENNAILTKDNLIRRHWVGSPCCFCHEDESVDHLFFQCPIAKTIWGVIGLCFGASNIPKDFQQYRVGISNWLPRGETIYTCGCAAVCWAIWKCRNKACFNKKVIKSPSEIIIHICAFLTYWAGLYNQKTQGKILEGVQALLACAHMVMASQPSTLN